MAYYTNIMPTLGWSMNIDRSGIILYVENYEKCVSFYSDILELKVEFQNSHLTSFDFGGSYLMVERGGVASVKGQEINQNSYILRINVIDIKEVAELMRFKGVEVEYAEYEWGTVAKFTDPDGNYCELKDSEKFNLQVSSGQQA